MQYLTIRMKNAGKNIETDTRMANASNARNRQAGIFIALIVTVIHNIADIPEVLHDKL